MDNSYLSNDTLLDSLKFLSRKTLSPMEAVNRRFSTIVRQQVPALLLINNLGVASSGHVIINNLSINDDPFPIPTYIRVDCVTICGSHSTPLLDKLKDSNVMFINSQLELYGVQGNPLNNEFLVAIFPIFRQCRSCGPIEARLLKFSPFCSRSNIREE